MCPFCLPEAFPGHVSRTVLPTSQRPPVPTWLLLCKSSPRLNLLESTLTSHSTTAYSKQLTSPPLSFRINTYKKPGWAGASSAPKFVNSLLPTAPPNSTQPTHSLLLYPQSFHPLAHGFRHTGGGYPHPSPNLKSYLQCSTRRQSRPTPSFIPRSLRSARTFAVAVGSLRHGSPATGHGSPALNPKVSRPM